MFAKLATAKNRQKLDLLFANISFLKCYLPDNNNGEGWHGEKSALGLGLNLWPPDNKACHKFDALSLSYRANCLFGKKIGSFAKH